MGIFSGPFSLLNQHEPASTHAGLQPWEATGGTSLPVELQSYCSDSFSVKWHICLLKPALELFSGFPSVSSLALRIWQLGGKDVLCIIICLKLLLTDTKIKRKMIQAVLAHSTCVLAWDCCDVLSSGVCCSAQVLNHSVLCTASRATGGTVSAKTTISLKGRIELHTHSAQPVKNKPRVALRSRQKLLQGEREQSYVRKEESSCSTGLLYSM